MSLPRASFGKRVVSKDYSVRAILPTTSESRHQGKMVTGYGRQGWEHSDTCAIIPWIEMDIAAKLMCSSSSFYL